PTPGDGFRPKHVLVRLAEDGATIVSPGSKNNLPAYLPDGYVPQPPYYPPSSPQIAGGKGSSGRLFSESWWSLSSVIRQVSEVSVAEGRRLPLTTCPHQRADGSSRTFSPAMGTRRPPRLRFLHTGVLRGGATPTHMLSRMGLMSL